MEQTATPKKLVAKLAKVMGSIKWVEKRGRNNFHNYDYATEADIVDAVRAKLAEEKVFVTTSVESVDVRPSGRRTREGAEILLTLAKTRHTFHDGDTGESLEVFGHGCGEDAGDKGIYKATTGAMKYFVSKNFLMSTGDDPEEDGEDTKQGAGIQERQPTQQTREDRGPAPSAPPARTYGPDSVQGDVVQTTVTDIQSKTGPKRDGSLYTRHSVQTRDAGFFTTFNAAYADLAQEASKSGQPVLIRFKQNGRWKDILSIRYAEEGVPVNGHGAPYPTEEDLPF